MDKAQQTAEQQYYRVGDLAKYSGLSRTTLLYYDKKGLLSPSFRTDNQYRCYSQADRDKLERILQLKKAGLPLAAIKAILANAKGEMTKILEARLQQINQELEGLQQQQWLIAALLKQQVQYPGAGFPDKAQWVAILKETGLNEQDMWNWHKAFEAAMPKAHNAFLQLLGLDNNEIDRIRDKSKSSDCG